MQVIKRSGGVQEFEFEKLVRSIVFAGGMEEDAREVASEAEVWAEAEAEEGKIKSVDLRTKVLEILREKYPEVAGKYETYTKTAS